MKTVDDLLINILDKEALAKCVNMKAIEKIVSEGIENAVFYAFENLEVPDEVYKHINAFMIEVLKEALPLKSKEKKNATARSRVK